MSRTPIKKNASVFSVTPTQFLQGAPTDAKPSSLPPRYKVQLEPPGKSPLQRRVYDLLAQDRRTQAFELLTDIKPEVGQQEFCEAVLYLGRFLLRNGLSHECFMMLKSTHEALRRVYRTEESPLYEEMGNMLYLSGQYADAVDWYSRMLEGEMAPESRLCFNIGMCYQSQQNYTKAIEFYYKATNADPKHHNAWQNLGTCYLRTSVHDKALNAFAQLPQNSEALTCVGNVHFHMGNWEEAVGAYLRALEISPEDCHALNNLGCALKNMELFEDALNAFTDSLAAKPTPDAVSNLITLQLELGRLEAVRGLLPLADKHLTAAEAKSVQKVYEELRRGAEDREELPVKGPKPLLKALVVRSPSLLK